MSTHNNKDGMLTTSEVAHLLNIHVNTARRWSDYGLFRVYRLGSRGDRRFKREDIDSFLLENCRKIGAGS